jgi:hypothetical protein
MSKVVTLKPKKREAPITEIRKVPTRPKNAYLRSRET